MSMKQTEIAIEFQCARKNKQTNKKKRWEHSHKVIKERKQIGILTLIQMESGPDHSLGKNKEQESH